MIQNIAEIVHNEKIKSRYYRLVIRERAIAASALPGQFMMVKTAASGSPLLRRPFSVHRVDFQGSAPGTVEMLYEVVGEGTKLLSGKNPGEYVDVMGPLGSSFVLGSSGEGERPVLIAGGVGVAPLLFLAQKIAETLSKTGAKNFREGRGRRILFLGSRTKDGVLCEKEFKKLGFDVRIATDDGSFGFRGKVTELLKKYVKTTKNEHLVFYACGPKPMLKEVSSIAQNNEIPAWGSFEAHMSCGIGACLGCVINTREGFKRVCKEGPVFNMREIIW